MKKNYISILVLVVVLLLIITVFFLLHSRNSVISYTASSTDQSKVSAQTTMPLSVASLEADASAAGYAVIKQELPTATMYELPAVYFRVADPQAKAPTDNLLMISQVSIASSSAAVSLYNYGTDIAPFAVSQSVSGQEGAVDGEARTAIDFIKDGMYVVVIGPNTDDVESLARLVAAGL